MGKLFIFVEGTEDELFFESIIKPLFTERYSDVRIWEYSQENLKRRRNFIRSIQAMQADYLYVTDINNAVCVTAKKESIVEGIGPEKDRIIVVVREIEGWYLAGISTEKAKKLGIQDFRETNEITKEQFNRLIPEEIGSRLVFMQNILKEYNIEIAKEKNKSLRHFLQKFGS